MILSFPLVLCFDLLGVFYIEIKYLLQSSSRRIWMHNCPQVPRQPSKVPSYPTSPNTPCRVGQACALLNIKTSSSNYSCHMSLVAASPPPYIQSKQEPGPSLHPLTFELMERHISPLTPKHSEDREAQVLQQSVIKKPGGRPWLPGGPQTPGGSLWRRLPCC